jgi:tRNA/tmRNA/rRNA uracil-C5-methylase (TrmA/RlmC/RlmD family)
MAQLQGEVRIDSLGAGGEGVGRLEGRAVFVPGAFPGDLVSVTRGKLKKRWGRAESWDLLERSPDRVESPCRWSGRCGGCDWMGYGVSAQRLGQGAILVDSLRRLGTLGGVPDEIEVVAAGPELGWRQRVRLHVRGDVGFHARKSRTIVPIDRCVVADDRINAVLTELRATPQGPGTITIQVEDEAANSYRGDAPFVQANPHVNTRLVADVVALAEGAGPFLELFAGGGNFTIPLAEAGLSGVTIESHGGAVAAARAWAERVGVEAQLDIRLGDATRLSPDISADLVLLDPPRVGAKETMGAIAELGPATVIYVSCDPGTLARDLRLLQDNGYALAGITAYDMFPHTHHVEAVAVMRR